MVKFSYKSQSITCMVIGISTLTCGEAILKLLTSSYSPLQILFFRSLISLPLLLLYWIKNKSLSDIFQVNVREQLIRSSLLTLSILLTIISLSFVDFFQYYEIFFTSPFFIVIFSTFFFKEENNKAVWIPIMIGFLGVVVVVKPSITCFVQIGGFTALLSAACYGLGMIFTSKLSKINSPLLMTIWYTGTCLIVGSGCLIFTFSPSLQDIPFFSLAAVLNIGANFFIIKSFQYASASYLACLEYMAIPVAGLLGYLIWSQLPNANELIGSLIIVGSGLYLFRIGTGSNYLQVVSQ